MIFWSPRGHRRRRGPKRGSVSPWQAPGGPDPTSADRTPHQRTGPHVGGWGRPGTASGLSKDNQLMMRYSCFHRNSIFSSLLVVNLFSPCKFVTRASVNHARCCLTCQIFSTHVSQYFILKSCMLLAPGHKSNFFQKFWELGVIFNFFWIFFFQKIVQKNPEKVGN